MIDEGVPLISDGLVLEMNRKTLEESICFLGVVGYLPFKRGKMLGERPGVSTSDKIWDKFFDIQSDIPSISGGRRIGVYYQGDAPEGHTTYFAGVEVEQDRQSSCFASWILPEREYVVCSFQAENFKYLSSAVGKAMKYTRSWLKGHGLIADGFFSEIYYNNSLGITYMELWIPFKQRDE